MVTILSMRGAKETPDSGLSIVEEKRDFDPAQHLVMFSGGRDSTIATLRLASKAVPISLITISSNHLFGIDRVESRLVELSSKLPPNTTWTRILQPTELRTDTTFYEQTCLPCHHAYVAASGWLSEVIGVRNLVFGYTQYQSTWPEQTPLAIRRLTSVLDRYGIKLILPVYDLISREAAIAELLSRGMDPGSSEQKCIRQVTNVELNPRQLESQVALWEAAIDNSMANRRSIKVEIVEKKILRGGIWKPLN